ncbi:MAG TPA: hypothetical protein DEA96_00245 [Leptospiraceae bacterium]|nr:hypothetical protein [Leptospiraceae bacterium]
MPASRKWWKKRVHASVRFEFTKARPTMRCTGLLKKKPHSFFAAPRANFLRNICPGLAGILLLLLQPVLGGSSLEARTFEIQDGFSSTPLSDVLEVFEDTSGELEPSEVQRAGFRPVGAEVWNRGLSSAAHWFRFSLKNSTEHNDPIFLEIFYPLLDSVILYRPDKKGGYSPSATGDMLPFSHREMEHRNFIFVLRIPPGQTRDYLLRVSSSGPLQVPLRLRTAQDLLQKDRTAQYAQGVYFGIMLAMILYNAFLFIAVRYSGYLHYVFYILGLTLFQLLYHGFFFAIFLPDYPVLVNEALVFSIAFMLFWGIQFSRTFLNTRRYDPLLDRPLLVLQALSVVGGISSFVIPYQMALNFSVLSSVTFVLVIFATALRRLYRGYRPARFFLLAWSTLLVAILVLALKQYGWIPYTFLTNYAMQIGSGMEVILLSVALGDRIKAIEKEKKEAQAFAYQSLKKAHHIKDEFLYNTSLELREPIEGIVGMAEGLLELSKRSEDRPGRIDEIRDGLSVVASTGTIVSGLVNDILDFYRIKNSEIYLNRTSVSPASVVSVAMDLCRPWAVARGIELKIEIPGNVNLVHADEVRLRQILLNLLNNGIKFTQEGSVTVRARNLDQFVEFTIEDTGSGIPSDALEDIFFIFERPELAAGRKGGKGLGLTITRKLIELHGGLIRAESAGEGTRMIFTIPRSNASHPILPGMIPGSKESEPIPDYIPGHQGSHTILIADDDTIHLRAQERRLIQAGYRVLSAGNLQSLRRHLDREPVDLMIIDLYLNGQNGYELCREIRRDFSLHEMPVIIVGRGRSQAELEAAMENGANDYISRPVDRVELLSRVQMLLELRDSILERERLLSFEKELDVARSIMQRLIPAQLALPDGFDGSVLYLPAGTIGGDIYDFQNGDWFNLLIADVTGHGVPAALYASMVKIAHTVALREGKSSPAEILESIHGTIRNQLSEHFVTAGYLRIHPESQSLQYSRAGHLPLLIHRRASNDFTELNPGGRLLGLVDELNLEKEEIQLQSGDRIFCYTDGIHESVTESGLHFGEKEFKELAAKCRELGPDQTIQRITDRLSELSELAEQIEDDRTMILIDVK